MGESIHRSEGGSFEAAGRSPTQRLRSVADLVEIAGQMKASTVIVAGGDRVEDLRLVESARDHGIVDRIILVGQKQLIDRSVRHLGIEIQPEDIVDAANDEEVAAAVVRLIRGGGVDIALKGNISTPILNRHMLGITVRSTVSLVSIFDAAPISDGKPIVLTDAGFTTVCNFGRMVDLANNAIEVAHLVMKIPVPKVAILSANEKQIPSLPSTWIGAKLSERNWPDAVVYGPLSFDLATDPGSVAVKGVPDTQGAREVAGHADVLVCPGIDSANILYKTISAMVKYGQASLAGITVGFLIPYIIISRSDSLSTRLESIALCSIYSQQRAKNRAEVKERGTASGRQGGAPRSHEQISVEHAAPATGGRYGLPVEHAYHVLALALDSDPKPASIRLAVFENDKPAREARIGFEDTGAADSLVRIDELKTLLFQTLDQWNDLSLDAVVTGSELTHPLAGGASGGTANGAGAGVTLLAEVVNGKTVVDRSAVDSEDSGRLERALAASVAERLSIPAFAVDRAAGGFGQRGAAETGATRTGRIPAPMLFAAHSLAKKASLSIGRPVEDLNLIVVQANETVTISALSRGQVIDAMVQMELGALHDGTLNGPKHERSRSVIDSAIYEIAKGIGAMFAAVECDVEAIVLAGEGLADEKAGKALRKRVGRLAPVMVIEGDAELEALAVKAFEVLSGRVHARRSID